MKASDLVVSCLEAEGVEHVFGLPGEENEDLLFSLRDSSITFVQVRHEQGAAFMADVHGRITGNAGVCLSTLGPGATNLLTGIADAHLDKSPLVAITGQGGLERLHKESHQTVDVLDTFEPVTKWNAQLNDPDIINESVRKAFKLAELEKPGATHLELPEDVAGEDTDERPIEPAGRTPGSRPNADALDRVERLLSTADRPLFVVGNGVTRADASRPFRNLVDRTGIPVASTYMGKGVIPDDDPRSLMTLESGDDDETMAAIAEADLVVAVGYDIAEHDPSEWNSTGDAPVVHVDSRAAEVDRAYSPEVEVVADVDLAVRELADRAPAAADFDGEWYEDYREGVRDSTRSAIDSDAPFELRGVLPLLREAMEPDDVLVSDVGQHKMTIARNFPTYDPNTCIVSNGMASMGIAVPGALAADRAADASVVAATGDGGFLMNAAEIETATRVGCGFTIVVFNDDDYRLISDKQREHRGESFGTELSNPDLVTFAESFGVEAARPETPPELETAFEAIQNDEMTLIEVPTAK